MDRPDLNKSNNPELNVSTLLSQERNPLQEFAHAAAYASLQSPITAVTQIVDRAFQTNIEKTLQFISAPEEKEFLSAPWCGQQAGLAAGSLAPVLLLHTGVSFGARRLVSPQFATGLASRETHAFGKGAFLAGEAALTGTIFGAALTPSDQTKGDLWTLRAKQAVVGGSTFATLSAASSGIKALGGHSGNKLFGAFLNNDLAATTLAGIPAGMVSANSESLLSGHGWATLENQTKAAITMTVTGAGLGLGTKYISRLSSPSSSPRSLQPESLSAPVERVASPVQRVPIVAEVPVTEFALKPPEATRSGSLPVELKFWPERFPASARTIRFPELSHPVEDGMIVITGGPGVGKSTVIQLLREAGYPVSEEVAARIIKEGEYHPLKCKDTFQRRVFEEQIEVERPLVKANGLRFLDRGLLDGEPYYTVDGAKPPTFFDAVPGRRYTLALLLDELPFFENNGVRFENLEFTRRINPKFGMSYSERGVPVVRIPAVGTPKDRVKMILDVARSVKPAAS